MKGKNKSLIGMFPALVVLALNVPANAQDDLYYDPSTDNRPVQTTKYEETYEEPNNVTRRYDGDDEYYYEEDDYAYEYSSRIRRFHRPSNGVDYYDPLFVDLYYYDPFFLPGASIYTYGYNDYWRWRRWQRWNRWNAWNPYNPWNSYGFGWNSWGGFYGGGGFGYGGYNAWNNPWVWNNYYYDPYWTWNGCNPYYGNAWVNNNYYYNNNSGNNNGYRPQTYTGPRHGGTTVNPGYARLANGTGSNGRLVASDKSAPVIEMARPNGRTNLEKAPTDKAVDQRGTNPTRPTTGARDPNATDGRNRVEQQTDKARPTREDQPSRDVTPSRRPTQEPTETRPSRQPAQETRPSRQPSQETRPARDTETRPSRPSGDSNEKARPSRPSSQDRPSRNVESNPSRSENRGTKMESGSSGRSSSGSGSSGGSRSGGSSGGSRSGGGGGSRGRN